MNSHTGERIANLVCRVIDIIRVGRIIAVSSDGAGNCRVAREIIALRIKTILNLPDPNHHLNNTWKDIVGLSYFQPTVKVIRVVVKYFKKSNFQSLLPQRCLNQNYIRSSIFKKPNALSFSITVPGQEPLKAPAGIRNPKTFLEVGECLYTLLVEEVNHGSNPFLTAFKGKPNTFNRRYQADPLDWWLGYEGSDNGGILAAIAIKLHSAVPYSMADERTMSTVTMLNTAQQSVATVMAMAQVGGYYRNARPSRVSCYDMYGYSLLLTPSLRSTKLNCNYDESDDEDDVDLSLIGDDGLPCESAGSFRSMATLPVDGDDEEVNMASVEFEEILVDAPVALKATKSAPNAQIVVQPTKEEEEEEEEDGNFELFGWVQAPGSRR
ncbi:hypothetical protein CVT26_005389 [Gymnopilus dilepis]|uniref:DUF659 domain-containing protein n=1 Tax=Gymnopilus dilepis TaxID=231916 RepID=A0A409WH29_9AGAR|nr:hypothetical protein CVT26_005389 [Gymnopilus dilepis]